MKFLHTSDLHIGLKLYDYSLYEDQKHILKQIVDIAVKENVDVILLAGDIYDKSVASEEAVSLLDEFISDIYSKGIKVCAISGNHDSADRISFGGRIMDSAGVHFSHTYDGTIKKVVLSDKFGDVNIYLFPFIKPTNVRARYPESEINNYTDAVSVALQNTDVDFSQRNILLCHQYVTGSVKCDSENVTIGGLDNVDADVFEGFDYVALGHIHSPQIIGGNEHIRYSGTPLKYSVSEIRQTKSVTIGEISEKGNLSLNKIELTPLRDVITIKGKLSQILDREFYENINRDCYVNIILTDEEENYSAISEIRKVYPRFLKISYDNTRVNTYSEVELFSESSSKTPLELISELYLTQNGMDMTPKQQEALSAMIEEIWEVK